jgi:hypothetical protein
MVTCLVRPVPHPITAGSRASARLSHIAPVLSLGGTAPAIVIILALARELCRGLLLLLFLLHGVEVSTGLSCCLSASAEGDLLFCGLFLYHLAIAPFEAIALP